MKFLLDECVWKGAGEALRQAGHEVRFVSLEAVGMPDEDVLDWGEREDRVVITHDRRMGHLVAEGRHTPRGLVVVKQSLARDTAEILLPLLNILPGHLVTIDKPGEERIRPLVWARTEP